MKLVGLTGSIATGKSTVTQMLRDFGLPVIDTDEITAQLQQNPQVIQQLVAIFGPTVKTDDGGLNRQALGAIIFADTEAREKLGDFMHPLIKAEMLAQAKATKQATVIIDVPLLFETDYYQLCAKTIVVAIEPETQLQRLMMRDSCSLEQAQAKIASQLPIAYKVAKADYVINNQGTRKQTKRQVKQLVDKLKLI